MKLVTATQGHLEGADPKQEASIFPGKLREEGICRPNTWVQSERVRLSCVRLFVTPRTVARQASLSVGFSRQEYWSRLSFLLQGIFPSQGCNPGLLHCRRILYHLSHREAQVG